MLLSLLLVVMLAWPHARQAAAAPDDWIPPPPPLPYPAEDPLLDSEEVGTLPGSHAVGPTGDFTYRLPLDQTRIRSHGDSGRGPGSFTVWAKGGRTTRARWCS